MKIFVSYCQADRAHLATLRSWLSDLERSGEISIWTDGELVGGQPWDDAIISALHAADLVLFLVTQSLLAGDYINRIEIRQAIDQAHRGQKRVLPILVEQSYVKQSPLGGLQCLPAVGTPIMNATPPESGWLMMREGLDKVLASQRHDTVISTLMDRISRSRRITHLPELFPGLGARPVASLYVELRLARQEDVFVSDTLVSRPLTLSEQLHQRREHRRSRAVDVETALGDPAKRRILLVGDPGGGKSSLLKFITTKIVSNELPNWGLPLHVDFRRLVDLKLKDEPWTARCLLRLVFEHWQVDPTLSKMLSSRLLDEDVRYGRIVLLLDGLDEIIGQSSDHAALCEILSSLPDSIDWIITSRITGLTRDIGEDTRYEVSQLDDFAIEALVRNWWHHEQSHPGTDIAVEVFLSELFANPRLLAMARNPFLASSLCYLRSFLPDSEYLPTTRAEIYDALLRRIARQAQIALEDDTILNEAATKTLAAFCYWTYSRATNGPKHIFSERDWVTFLDETESPTNGPRPENVSFTRQVVPARLLAQLAAGDERFHFMHLSLQEFLVARHLLTLEVAACTNLRFFPAWRDVLQFYGVLLVLHERWEDFKALARAIGQPPDFGQLMLIEAARLFSEAGVSDSKAVLGYDLADHLWKIWNDGEDHLSEAAFDALCQLPHSILSTRAEGLETAARASVNKIAEKFSSATGTTGNILGEGTNVSLFERSLVQNIRQLSNERNNPFSLAASRRDGKSEQILLAKFLNEPDPCFAIYMASSVATSLTHTGRSAFIAAARSAQHPRDRIRFLEVIRTDPHPAFVSLLTDWLIDPSTDDASINRICHVIATVKDEKFVPVLLSAAKAHGQRGTGAAISFQTICQTLGGISQTPAATLAFLCDGLPEALCQIADASLSADPDASPEATFANLLEAKDLYALANAISSVESHEHREPVFHPEQISRIWKKTLNSCAQSDNPEIPAVIELAVSMDQQRVAHGCPPNPDIFEWVRTRVEGIASRLLDPSLNCKPVEAPSLSDGDLLALLPRLLDYLSPLRCPELANTFLELASLPLDQIGLDAIESALEALAQLTRGRDPLKPEFLVAAARKLETSCFASAEATPESLGATKAFVIGLLDIDTLFAHRDDTLAQLALSRISAETGYLFYPSFFVTPEGVSIDKTHARTALFSLTPLPSQSQLVTDYFNLLYTNAYINELDDIRRCRALILILPAASKWNDLPEDLRQRFQEGLAALPKMPAYLLMEEPEDAAAELLSAANISVDRLDIQSVHERDHSDALHLLFAKIRAL